MRDLAKDEGDIDMKARLDSRSAFPEDMENYLEFNGWHFNKKMCQWASSRMYKGKGKEKQYITPYTKGGHRKSSQKIQFKF